MTATPARVAPGTIPWTRERSELLGADGTLIALFLSSAHSFQTWQIDPAKARLAYTPEAEHALDYAIHAANNHAPLLAALEVFSEALGEIAGPDTERWPDDETIEYSGAAEMITWGDLRRARQAIAAAKSGGGG